MHLLDNTVQGRLFYNSNRGIQSYIRMYHTSQPNGGLQEQACK